MQHSDTLLTQITEDAALQSGISFTKKPKVWAKTKQKNLVRNVKTDWYYARTWIGGREVWKSLGTAHYSVVQAKLAEFLKEHRQRVGNGAARKAATAVLFLIERRGRPPVVAGCLKDSLNDSCAK